MTTATLTTPPRSKGLHVGLWVAQGLLGAAFVMAGVLKSTQPIADLAAKMPWAAGMPEAAVRFIGVSEFLGALGLILPSALRIKPWLTPVAAAALLVVMVLAAGVHVSRGEPIVPNVVLGALLGFVAFGRWKKAPISA